MGRPYANATRTYARIRGSSSQIGQGAHDVNPAVGEHWGVDVDRGTDKLAMRSQVRAARKLRDLGAGAELDSDISRHICDLLAMLPVTPESVVAAYVAMPFEPAVNALRSQLRELGCRVLIPIVSGDDLLWAPDGDEDSWARNSFGTLEPDPLALGGALTSAQALPMCAAIIVPAQAIDPRGFRLGQGKGFYDRALTQLAGLEHSPLLVGVTYESEFLPEVPTEEHDIPVDVSVTESTVRWFNTPD